MALNFRKQHCPVWAENKCNGRYLGKYLELHASNNCFEILGMISIHLWCQSKEWNGVLWPVIFFWWLALKFSSISKRISEVVSYFFFDLSDSTNVESHSLWTVKNDCGTPTHQTKQQWTAKYVEKNRVSWKITTQNNKNVIFIGFDGQFDLKPTSKIKKKTRKLTRFVFANNCT